MYEALINPKHLRRLTEQQTSKRKKATNCTINTESQQHQLYSSKTCSKAEWNLKHIYHLPTDMELII